MSHGEKIGLTLCNLSGLNLEQFRADGQSLFQLWYIAPNSYLKLQAHSFAVKPFGTWWSRGVIRTHQCQPKRTIIQCLKGIHHWQD